MYGRMANIRQYSWGLLTQLNNKQLVTGFLAG